VKPEYFKDSPHLENIKPEYQGELEEILAELLRSIVVIDLIVPGGHFKSTQGGPYVKCSLKTQNGWLYFLKKSMIFITKPVIYFRVPDIDRVEFQRVGGSNKLFDMKIILKSGQGHAGQTSQFVGIERTEYDAITDYFKQREVSFKRIGDDDQKHKKIESEDDDDSEEDEDFDANAHEDDDGDDDASVSLSN
jgi:structure-specific recognition protein 1